MYAIVDIETTGGHASANSITEICIYVHDGEKVVDHYETLVNPGRSIPRYISAYTNITDDMVEDAPSFEMLAGKIHSLLHDKIFVAHSVNFDYSFINHALSCCGFNLNTKKLCTIRMSRKIFPGYRSYSLGNLCNSLNIPIENRHRAGGDAAATVLLFEKLLREDQEGHIKMMLKRGTKEHALPAHLPRQQIDQLPGRPGVYYFHNAEGKVVYVGKAKSLKSRVSSHFLNNSTSSQKQNFMKEIHSITYEETATEFMALLLESHEIKHYWPPFNRAQKKYDARFGLFDYQDRQGYLRLGLELITKHRHARPLLEFSNRASAFSSITELSETFQLCLRLTGIAKECISEECACKDPSKVDAHNLSMQEMIDMLGRKESYAIIDQGRNSEEYSAIYVESGKIAGMGYVPSSVAPQNQEEIASTVKRYKQNFFMQNLVENFAARNPEKKVVYA